MMVIRSGVLVKGGCVCPDWGILNVLCPRLLVELELMLDFLIKTTEILHFCCGWMLPLDGVVDNAHTCAVVLIYYSRKMYMSHRM